MGPEKELLRQKEPRVERLGHLKTNKETLNILNADANDNLGMRDNKEKPRPALLSPWATEEKAKVAAFGARKYSDRNWERGLLLTSIIDSLERHLIEIKKGRLRDLESHLLHAAHLAWNADALLHFIALRREDLNDVPGLRLEIEEPETDY